jgi:hypothetical protein
METPTPGLDATPMTRFRLALLALALSTPAWAADARYSNERFRFTARIPGGLQACPHIPPAPDPGFIVPLSSQGCAAPLDGAFLSVVGEYNMRSFGRAEQAAAERCEGQPSQPSSANPKIRFRACERRLSADAMLITYVALRLTPTPEWPRHGYVYTVSLRCHPADCARLRPLLRDAVASIRVR